MSKDHIRSALPAALSMVALAADTLLEKDQMLPKISVCLLVCSHRMSVAKTRVLKEFDGWFDFADFLKQENEKGNWIEIHSWHYLPKEEPTGERPGYPY